MGCIVKEGSCWEYAFCICEAPPRWWPNSRVMPYAELCVTGRYISYLDLTTMMTFISDIYSSVLALMQHALRHPLVWMNFPHRFEYRPRMFLRLRDPWSCGKSLYYLRAATHSDMPGILDLDSISHITFLCPTTCRGRILFRSDEDCCTVDTSIGRGTAVLHTLYKAPCDKREQG